MSVLWFDGSETLPYNSIARFGKDKIMSIFYIFYSNSNTHYFIYLNDIPNSDLI